jgi:3-oxoacyl-[acyl-carrier-protein] synthase III
MTARGLTGMSVPEPVVTNALLARCMSTSDNNIDRYGNTAGASVPICLHEALSEGRIKDGDLVMLVAFGTGFSWGATLLRW